MIYLRLYWEFFKVGLFAIGGGLATIPFLYQLSDKTAWFTAADIVNMFAISEVTPGPVGINMATFAGVHTTGLLGGLIATIGIVTPALLAVVLIAGALKKYMQNKRAQAAFFGMQAAVCALISASVLKIITSFLLDIDLYKETGRITDLAPPKPLIFFVILFFAIRNLKWHPFVFICASAALGIFIQF